MRVAIFQSEADESFPQKRIEKLEKVLHQQEIDLLVCPELFTSGYNKGDLLKITGRTKQKMYYFSLNDIKFCILICYDAEFPESIRAGVEVIIVPTALVNEWGVVANKIMPTRAFENGVWVLYANHAGSENSCCYYGGSCIIKPDGKDAARAGANEELIYATIEANAVKIAQERLPYLKKNVSMEKDYKKEIINP